MLSDNTQDKLMALVTELSDKVTIIQQGQENVEKKLKRHSEKRTSSKKKVISVILIHGVESCFWMLRVRYLVRFSLKDCRTFFVRKV